MGDPKRGGIDPSLVDNLQEKSHSEDRDKTTQEIEKILTEYGLDNFNVELIGPEEIVEDTIEIVDFQHGSHYGPVNSDYETDGKKVEQILDEERTHEGRTYDATIKISIEGGTFIFKYSDVQHTNGSISSSVDIKLRPNYDYDTVLRKMMKWKYKEDSDEFMEAMRGDNKEAAKSYLRKFKIESVSGQVGVIKIDNRFYSLKGSKRIYIGEGSEFYTNYLPPSLKRLLFLYPDIFDSYRSDMDKENEEANKDTQSAVNFIEKYALVNKIDEATVEIQPFLAPKVERYKTIHSSKTTEFPTTIQARIEISTEGEKNVEVSGSGFFPEEFTHLLFKPEIVEALLKL